MAKRELKVHYVPAGQKVWTICGKKVKPRVKGMEHPYTCGAAVVTCENCRKAMKEMVMKKALAEEAVSRRDERVHFADKADLEIGTARCGASLKNARAAGQMELVTCEKCNSALLSKSIAPVVHLEKKPELGESVSPKALLCGAEYTVVARTDNARNCTCPDCLRMMADGWARKFGEASARAALYEKQAAEFKDFSQAAVTRADAAEQRADREKDIREAADEIAVKALGNIKELEKKAVDVSKALNDATVRFQYAEAQNSYLNGELESMKNERGVLREEVQRWKAAASVALALNNELFSCTTLR